MNKIFYYIIAVSLVGLASCKQESKKDIKEVKLIEAPIFNPDSAYLYIEQQVDFGPRFLSSPG